MSKLSGGLNNWYVVPVKNPQRKEQEPYQAECEDIIQALGMTFDEGCAFKALWRNAAARMGNGKPGNTAVYDAEKLVHYANRILAKERIAAIVEPFTCNGNTVSNEFSHGIYVSADAQKNGERFRSEETVNTSRNTPSSLEGVDWIYSSALPIIINPYESIDVVYRNGKRNSYMLANQVDWNLVLKYRINYS